jgi:5-methylthioribose kinase
MDDQQIALLILNADTDNGRELGFNLFKQLGYGKNKIKRLIMKEVKKMTPDEIGDRNINLLFGIFSHRKFMLMKQFDKLQFPKYH